MWPQESSWAHHMTTPIGEESLLTCMCTPYERDMRAPWHIISCTCHMTPPLDAMLCCAVLRCAVETTCVGVLANKNTAAPETDLERRAMTVVNCIALYAEITLTQPEAMAATVVEQQQQVKRCPQQQQQQHHNHNHCRA